MIQQPPQTKSFVSNKVEIMFNGFLLYCIRIFIFKDKIDMSTLLFAYYLSHLGHNYFMQTSL
jgi:hypothetical protein